MILDSISIINYKNIEQADLSFSPKINCFVGQNGVGKTNLLDAIYYLSFCKSAFNPIDSQNIYHSAEFLMLQGRYKCDEGQIENIYCGLKRHRKKIFKRNDKEYSKLSEHIGRIPLVLISPSDIEMILGGSEERRRFLDMVIVQYSSNYLFEEIRYRKALQQRNTLLKEDSPVDIDYISIYEDVMADAGEKIYALRKSFIKEFSPIFQNIYHELSEDSEDVGLKYISNCEGGDLRELITKSRSKDMILGFSLCGIHRDDLDMTLGGYAIKREGSQGQNKSFLVALKLAQFEFLKKKSKKTPILLLDDIFDKLDTSRVEKILNLVSSDTFGQIFITDTDRNFLSKIIEQTGKVHCIFEVKGGKIDEIQ